MTQEQQKVQEEFLDWMKLHPPGQNMNEYVNSIAKFFIIKTAKLEAEINKLKQTQNDNPTTRKRTD